MEAKTIYKISKGNKSYEYRTGTKNDNDIYLFYADEDGEYCLNTYNKNDGKDALIEMREDFSEYIKEDRLVARDDRKYVKIDFDIHIRDFLNLPQLDLTKADILNQKQGLKKLLNMGIC